MRAARVAPKELRRVVIAASVGNIIEWYDFYIFGSLAAILAVKFFEKGHPVAAFLSTVAIFSVGFLIRPLGAFVFGWLGDKVGRKYTFIVTLTGMGLAPALHHLAAPRRHRHLDPALARGDADLPGDEGQGADHDQSVARSLHERQLPVCGHRQRGGSRPGLRLVQRPVLGALFPADGQ